MSDEKPDKESKTEEASEKKIRDSLDKGQTPFSKETPILGEDDRMDNPQRCQSTCHPRLAD